MQETEIQQDAVIQEETNEEPVSIWKTGWRKELIDWVVAIGVAVVIAMVLRTFGMTLALVDGASMENTLHDGERLYVNKLFYTPEKGDIVIIESDKHPKGALVKRVIATEGDTIYIDPYTAEVYVNGELIEEDYIKGKTVLPVSSVGFGGIGYHGEFKEVFEDPTYSLENPIVIGNDEVFVMGDNRENSSDSRNLGLFREDEIMGHAVFRFWPLGDFGTLD
ncbi:MAG: signal peptidase I [Ruminococcaceae bacterium]|nr:signal peptidase I [Oscillospiraceae bacterium]